jgi:hypothetical protein
MAVLVAQQITKYGITPSFATAVSASDTLTPDSVGMFLAIRNAGGTQDVVTIDDAGTTPGGNSPTDPTVTVPITTGEKWIYIVPSYVNPATGVITISHSFTTSVTCGLFRVV